jgi:hypothetical protein
MVGFHLANTELIMSLQRMIDMADITMCRDETCKKRERCYRFTARVTPEYQSYFVNSPRDGKECKYFWLNDDNTKRLRKNCE